MNLLNRKSGFSDAAKSAVLEYRTLGATSSASRNSSGASQKPRAWSVSYRAVEPIAIATDVAIIFLTCLCSGVIYHLHSVGGSGDIAQYAAIAAVASALFVPLARNRDLYNPTELLNFRSQVRQIALLWFSIALFLTGVAFTLKVGQAFSRGSSLAFVIAGLMALTIHRAAWRILLAEGLAAEPAYGRKIILITDRAQESDSDILQALARHGLRLTRQFVLPASGATADQNKEVFSQAIVSARGSDVAEIIVGVDLERWPALKEPITELRAIPLPVRLVPIGPTADLLKQPLHMIGENLAIELQHGPRTLFQLGAKRVFDILFASTALLVMSPLLIMVAIAIKIESPGAPILFLQRRCGFNGRQFRILKFRTMSVMEDGHRVIQAACGDLRVTRLGKWLRRTSIDELPQLINVLRGSMSIIGPRPHAIAHDSHYDQLVSNYAIRHHVKPGLTGWAQVHGYRGQTATVADMEARVKLDLWYIDNWSFSVDLRIVFMTIVELLRGRNAY